MSRKQPYRYSLVCPKCGKLCPLGSKWCSNCGASLLKKKAPFLKNLRKVPKSFLQSKNVFVIFSSLMVLFGGIGIFYGVRKYTSVSYTEPNYKKIKVIYLDKKKHPLQTQYYVIRGDGKSSNYFSNKKTYLKNKSIMEKKVAFISNKDRNLNIVKAYLKSPKGRMRIDTANKKIEFLDRNRIILSSKDTSNNFLDVLIDHGVCFYKGKPKIKYYKWIVISY